jgi:hypothetical protein
LGERHTKTSLHVRSSRDSSDGGEGEQLVHFVFNLLIINPGIQLLIII